MEAPTRTATARCSLADLLARAGIGPKEYNSHFDVKIVALTDDSRAVGAGDCFVAVRGHSSDGHRFVESAVRTGAVCVVVDRDVSVAGHCVVVKVPDTRAALARLAAAYYRLRPGDTCPLELVGITGTNGKTTVAWMLRAILSAAGHGVGMIGTVEYDLCGRREPAKLTTPGAIELCRNLRSAADMGASHAVVEVSSHALDQRRCDGLTFGAGVFTNFSGDHLDYHGTSEAYLTAKRRLFEGLAADAVAIISADDEMGAKMARATRARVVRFGIEAPSTDAAAKIISLGRRGSEFAFAGVSTEFNVRCPLVGRHNVLNALAAAATAEALGINPDAIRRGLEGLAGVPGRLERVGSMDCPFDIFVDYAHTDDALDNVLRVLAPLTAGRLICVFGCGGDRDHSKRPRMGSVVARRADVAYVTSDNPRTEEPRVIIDDILPGFAGFSRCRVEVEADRGRAIATAIAGAGPGDTVLIAGKGHEDYQLVGDKVLHFDDREVALSALSLTAENAA